jgi:hypothetical protein
MLEKTVEDHLRDEIKAMGGVCWKLPAQWYRNIPDRIVLLPGSKLCFIELKRPGKKARDGQKRMGKILTELGFNWAVLDTKEKVNTYLEKLICN